MFEIIVQNRQYLYHTGSLYKFQCKIVGLTRIAESLDALTQCVMHIRQKIKDSFLQIPCLQTAFNRAAHKTRFRQASTSLDSNMRAIYIYTIGLFILDLM